MSKAQGDIGENAEIAHSNYLRNEPKRSHQWFMDGNESESFPNKKQAVEIPHPNSYTALLNSNVYCENLGQFGERFFDNETPRTTNQFGIDSAFGGFSYRGIRKVKVSQVKDAEDFLSDTFNRGDDNFISVGEPYGENHCSMSVGPSASKDDSSITTTNQLFMKDDENRISMDTLGEHNNSFPMDLVFSKADDLRMSMIKNSDSGLSMRHSFGEDNIISFGGLNEDANNFSSSGRLVCDYDFLMGQSSVQRSSEEKGFSESTSDAIVSGAQVISTGDAILKKKEQKIIKKVPANNFPSNVRSLLSTGMLDGVSVKYVAWSKEVGDNCKIVYLGEL